MSRRLLSLLATALAVWPAAGLAAAAAPIALDEATFVARYQAADARFAHLDAEVAAAEAEVTAASVRPDPTVSFEREEVFADAGGLPTHELSFVWPFDLSQRRGLRVAGARAGAHAAAGDRDARRIALVIDGLRAYHEAAYARLCVDVLRRERQALVRAVEIVRKRAGAGDASGYDLQRFELELAAYDDLLATAETVLHGARRRLAALVGQPDGLADALASLELPATSPALPGLLADALDGRPDYRAAKLRAEAAKARAAAGARGWVPTLGLTAGFLSADLGDETAHGYVIGLSLSIPIFDRGQGDTARALAEQRAAEADARSLENQVPAAVRLAHETLVRRVAQAQQFATSQLARLDQLLKTAETAYREGDASVVELLDAHRTARDARLRDLELRRDAKLAELDLRLALGRPL
jgi:cobalt-zinc-cadmium efflux system outer membrane protein